MPECVICIHLYFSYFLLKIRLFFPGDSKFIHNICIVLLSNLQIFILLLLTLLTEICDAVLQTEKADLCQQKKEEPEGSS